MRSLHRCLRVEGTAPYVPFSPQQLADINAACAAALRGESHQPYFVTPSGLLIPIYEVRNYWGDTKQYRGSGLRPCWWQEVIRGSVIHY